MDLGGNVGPLATRRALGDGTPLQIDILCAQHGAEGQRDQPVRTALRTADHHGAVSVTADRDDVCPPGNLKAHSSDRTREAFLIGTLTDRRRRYQPVKVPARGLSDPAPSRDVGSPASLKPSGRGAADRRITAASRPTWTRIFPSGRIQVVRCRQAGMVNAPPTDAPEPFNLSL